MLGEALRHIAGHRLVGIVGPPGAGKSTLAAALAETLESAVVVPMDGFHLANVELARLGLTDRKGAPETFDAAGFVHLLDRIARRDELVYAPLYSREVHESIGSAIPIHPATRTLLVEGNYLLHWPRAAALLDVTLYLDVPDDVRVAGLIARQIAMGHDAAFARDWVLRSDEANARIVAATRDRATHVLQRSP